MPDRFIIVVIFFHKCVGKAPVGLPIFALVCVHLPCAVPGMTTGGNAVGRIDVVIDRGLDEFRGEGESVMRVLLLIRFVASLERQP
jgi:hypothetical protein